MLRVSSPKIRLVKSSIGPRQPVFPCRRFGCGSIVCLLRVVIYQDGCSFRLDKVSGVLRSHIAELVAKPLTLGAHFLDEGHQLRSYYLEIGHELLGCCTSKLSHLFCLIHDVNRLVVLGKNPVSIAEHSEAVQLSLMLVLGLASGRCTSVRM